MSISGKEIILVKENQLYEISSQQNFGIICLDNS